MKPRDDDQSTSIATQSYCYLSIPRVFLHELRALPEVAAKRTPTLLVVKELGPSVPHQSRIIIDAKRRNFVGHGVFQNNVADSARSQGTRTIGPPSIEDYY